MSNGSPNNGAAPASARAWHGWWPLAITVSLSAILVALILRGGDETPPIPPMPGSPPDGAYHARVKYLPAPIDDKAFAATDVQTMPCSVLTEERMGRHVLRIRTHADGDEIIVDATTGRLIEVCDSTGKLKVWPLEPTMAPEEAAQS